jgi:hypothetical protein
MPLYNVTMKLKATPIHIVLVFPDSSVKKKTFGDVESIKQVTRENTLKKTL